MINNIVMFVQVLVVFLEGSASFLICQHTEKLGYLGSSDQGVRPRARQCSIESNAGLARVPLLHHRSMCMNRMRVHMCACELGRHACTHAGACRVGVECSLAKQ